MLLRSAVSSLRSVQGWQKGKATEVWWAEAPRIRRTMEKPSLGRAKFVSQAKSSLAIFEESRSPATSKVCGASLFN
jgi:hypothetical protein